MRYRLVIYSIVYEEIIEAIEYYSSFYPALGQRFETALQKALDQLELHPSRYFNLDDYKHWRIVIDGFPYAFIYSIYELEVTVKMLFSQL